jgi:hypothetical protein
MSAWVATPGTVDTERRLQEDEEARCYYQKE